MLTIKHLKRLARLFTVFLTFLVFSSSALAETDRFSIVPSFASQKGDWIATPSTTLLEKGSWHFSQITSYGYHPMELSLAGVRTDGIVDHLLVQQLGIARGLTDRLNLEAALPVVWWNRFTDPTTGETSNKVRLGDLTLQGRYRFYNNESFKLSFVPFLTLPTGSQATFSGDTMPTGGMRLIADKKFGDRVTLGVHVGSRFRQKAVFHDYDSASQLLTGVAGSVSMGRGFTAKTEIVSQTAFNDFYQNRTNSPVQLFLALNKDFGNSGWSTNIGPSLSLIRSSGMPLVGGFLGVSYSGKPTWSRGKSGKSEHSDHDTSANYTEAHTFTLKFRKRSATITPESKATLNKVAHLYLKNKKNLFIESDAYGKKTNKLTAPLFRKRVTNIRAYLTQQGVREKNIVVRPNSHPASAMNYRQVILRMD